MKKLLVLLVMAFLSQTVTLAQNETKSNDEIQKELAKERRAARKLAFKEISQRANRDAKQQAKIYKKEGYQPEVGMLSIEKQLTEVYVRKNTYDGNFPKYFTGTGTGRSTSAGMAHKQAETRARVDVAAAMKAEIVALTEETSSNTELSQGEIETIAKTVETNQTLVQQNLGRTEILLDIVREVNGVYEEKIIVCYNGSNAKDDLLKVFNEDSAEIKAKLQELLNKQE